MTTQTTQYLPIHTNKWTVDLLSLENSSIELAGFLLVTEGELQVGGDRLTNSSHVTLPSSRLVRCNRSAKFLNIHIFNDGPPANLDPAIVGKPIELGDYTVYELLKRKWSLALIDIYDSPPHCHIVETEIFVVVEGTLDIQVDGQSYHLEVGEAITIQPKQRHRVRSANKELVRVLCINFPAFDPNDYYPVEHANHV